MKNRLKVSMYTPYFGLTENPFSLTPDPRFLFMSQRHREALAHLLYGMGEKGGFVLLTGEVGTGKTTLCRSLLDQVPEGVEVALVLNPKQTAFELVASLCDELKVSYPPGTDSLKVLIDQLNLHLLEIHSKGRRTVLIIDEAQNLSIDVLEQVRLLTNLETSTKKLLQILLIGQPELQTMMAQPELRQLGQRITARYHLTPLLPDETIAYIQHRLEVAGCKRQLFTKGALRLVHRLSGGVPRLINTICDRSLLGAYAKHSEKVNPRLLRKAASEVMGPRLLPQPRRFLGWAVAILFIVLLWAGWHLIVSPMTPEPPLEIGKKPSKSIAPAAPASTKLQSQAGRVKVDEQAALPKGVEAGPVHDNSDEVSVIISGPEITTKKHKTDQNTDNTSNTLGKLLAAESQNTDIDTAFATLLGRWQETYPDLPGMKPCERTTKIGLRCYRERGNWTTLRHLNRPAILELIDGDQIRHYVTAVRMEQRDITLDFGDQQATFDQTEIEPFWFGDFTLLWRPPMLTSSVIREGDRGPDVLWLRAQLDLAEGIRHHHEEPVGEKTPIPSPLFDEKLKKRVMDFQRTHFVKADGMVGEQTLIQLNKSSVKNKIPFLYSRTQNGEANVVYP